MNRNTTNEIFHDGKDMIGLLFALGGGVYMRNAVIRGTGIASLLWRWRDGKDIMMNEV